MTTYRWRALWAGALLALAGFVVLIVGLAQAGALGFLAADLATVVFGWGPFVEGL
ncbi:MAG: hypothetical protein H6Q89_5309, partial [Myxococcaceae bacterium]|nr:hypothetical protein [Myxococcaceae bacterium]